MLHPPLRLIGLISLLFLLLATKSMIAQSCTQVLSQAQTAFDAGEYEQAQQLLNANSSCLNAATADSTQQHVHLLLGRCHRKLKRYDEALHHLDAAIRLASASNNHRIISEATAVKARVVYSQGDTEASAEYWRQTLDAIEQCTPIDSALLGIALHNAGNRFNNLGNGERAVAYFERAVPVRKAVLGEYSFGAMLTVLMLATAYESVDTRKAYETFQECLRILQGMDEPNRYLLQIVWNNMANLLVEGNDHSATLHAIRMSLSYSEFDNPDTYQEHDCTIVHAGA